jgi:hypothetical protein
MREFTVDYKQNGEVFEYCLRFAGSEREHIFDRFMDVRFFLEALGYPV